MQCGSKTFLHPKHAPECYLLGCGSPHCWQSPVPTAPAAPRSVSLLFVKGLLARTQQESCWHVTCTVMGVLAFHLSHQAVGWGRPRMHVLGLSLDGGPESMVQTTGGEEAGRGASGQDTVLLSGRTVFGEALAPHWGPCVCVRVCARMCVCCSDGELWSGRLRGVTAWYLAFCWGCRQGEALAALRRRTESPGC